MPLGHPESHELLRHSSDSESSVGFTESLSPKSSASRAGYSLSRWVCTTIYKIRHCQKRLVGGSLRPRGTARNFKTALKSLAGILALLFLFSIARAVLFPSYQKPPAHYDSLRDAVAASTLQGRGNPYHEKVFIAANILKDDLIRGVWGEAILELVDLLGEKNVFVSIYENDSGSGTAEALNELRNKLRCECSIVTGGHLPLDSFPTVTLLSGEKRVKRIAYLAEVRNRALRPLDPDYDPSDPSDPVSATEGGFRHASMTFDRILFLNDVYFSPLSALQLLFSTNLNSTTGRPSYQAACAVDFIGYAMFYDTFGVRDHEGFGMGMVLYPWFTSSGKAESRQDVLAGKDAVRVRSCWGGMIALRAAPFQKLRRGSEASSEATIDVPLRFRYEPEIYWEAAECCLLLADLTEKFPLSEVAPDTGIYINPFVRVAYTPVTYSWIPIITRFERAFIILQYIWSRVGFPEYNPRREERAGEEVERKTWVYDDGAEEAGTGSGSFRMVKAVPKPGGFCAEHRLFVMLDIQNGTNKDGKRNWETLPVPAG